MISLTTRNGIILSPQPRAKGCTIAAARVVLDAAVAAGAPEGMQWKERSVSSFMKELRKQLKRHAEIRVIAPQCDEKMQADTHLLGAAILSLVSNSLRHGGEQVHVTVSVEIAENSVTFRVDDDGAGIPDAVMQRINSTWEQADALQVYQKGDADVGGAEGFDTDMPVLADVAFIDIGGVFRRCTPVFQNIFGEDIPDIGAFFLP